MPIDLSIRDVPDHVAKELRVRARRNRRSLQREARAILEEGLRIPAKLTLEEFIEEGNRSGLRTPAEATRMIRELRDGR